MTFEARGIENLNTDQRFEYILDYCKALVKTETDKIALMANISAIIMAATENINWAGFYLYKNDALILGPFQGLPACTLLTLDQGVCAKAFRDKKSLRVADVEKFPGHIACDSNSRSELVIPLIKNDKAFGVLDIDSPSLDRFSAKDQKAFEKIVDFIKDYI
ncbi:GAF domain-containing protein [Peptoniphilus obesi]|uniref:GAF domain-containing protein n=1 Tax=Peptoniphilus obesi TaxID=1472765 RepID=UPI0004AE92A0|nr:GAF domain-containing protein [Peptoniphilus obesi]